MLDLGLDPWINQAPDVLYKGARRRARQVLGPEVKGAAGQGWHLAMPVPCPTCSHSCRPSGSASTVANGRCTPPHLTGLHRGLGLSHRSVCAGAA